jgi:hypothetical protein
LKFLEKSACFRHFLVMADPDDDDPKDKKRRLLTEQANEAAARRRELIASNGKNKWRSRLFGDKYECGPDVWDHGDQIKIRFTQRSGGPSPQQIQAMIMQALEKGWTDMYLYTGDGQPDLRMAAHVRQVMQSMGIPEDKLRCHDQPMAYQMRAQEKAMAANPAPAA